MKQQQEEEPEEQRIYLVTEGLRSKYTKASYASAFRQFKKFMNIQDEHILASYKPTVIEQKVIRYIEMLAANGRRRMTIEVHKAAILHFFEMNDIVLNKRKISRFIPENDNDNDDHNPLDRAYTVEEIHRIINEGCSDLRSKLMVNLMASTGMRVGALYDLRVGDLVRLDKYPLYMIWVYARSKSDKYYTFTTPECTELIDLYLDYRRRLGENITEKTPLTREMFDTNNPFIINQPRHLTDRMAQIVLEQALKRSGVNQGLQSDGSVQRTIMRSHGFRKFAITQMKKAKVDFSDREYLVGHKASLGLDYNYDRTSVEDRLEEWSKAIPLLTISPENKLRNQVVEQDHTIKARLEEKDKQIHVLLQRDAMNEDAISALSDKLQFVMTEIEKLKFRK